MDRVFSVGEISEFWSAPPVPAPTTPDDTSKMNRSASEWAFQRFLQEASASASASASDSSPPPPQPARPCYSSASDPNNDVVEIKVNDQPKPSQLHDNNIDGKNGSTPSLPVAPPNVPIDSEEYQAFLKSKLNLACAAVVALTRVKFWSFSLFLFLVSSSLAFGYSKNRMHEKVLAFTIC